MSPIQSSSGRGEHLRVLILVLSIDREPWRSLEAAQRETWAVRHAGVEILYLRGVTRGFGRSVFLLLRKASNWLGCARLFDSALGKILFRKRAHRVCDVIQTGTPEYWVGTSLKTRIGLNYAAENVAFDYLVRTNSSTYLHIPSLLAHLLEAPRFNYYAGTELAGRSYAQGTCIILSRDVVLAITGQSHWDYDVYDDIAVGEAAKRARIPFNPIPATAILNWGDFQGIDWEGEGSSFIFRVKTGGARDDDIEILRRVHEKMKA